MTKSPNPKSTPIPEISGKIPISGSTDALRERKYFYVMSTQNCEIQKNVTSVR